MSTQSSLVTSAPPLRAYAPAADLDIAPPSAREASDRARSLSPKNLRTEPGPVRFVIIALAVTFLTVFVVLPLVVVFAQAFSKGIGAYFAALAEPEALSAIRLTLLVAAISVSAQSGVRRDRGLGDREIRFPRQDLPDHADRPAVLGQPGDLGPRLRAAVRRAGLFRAPGCRRTTSTSCSRCPASRWRPSS